jgi:hypothetical protein
VSANEQACRPHQKTGAVKREWLVASRFLSGSREMTVADYERLREKTLDEMIAAGEITEQQRDKVFFVRFLAADQVERSGNGPPIPRRKSP